MNPVMQILMHLSPQVIAGVLIGLYLAGAYPAILQNENFIHLISAIVVILLGGKNSWDKLGLQMPAMPWPPAAPPPPEVKP